MRAIFVSYRRNDSEGEAGRLFDDLVSQFGENSVFMDVAAIEVGRDFRKAIDESVSTCGVLLAVIGKEWIDTKNEAGQRRLDDPSDFVRLETASALKRDIPVVPVLVRGARMPRPEELPQELKELAYRNGVELTHARWNSDLQLLIKALRRLVEPPAKEPPSPGKPAVVSMKDEVGPSPSGKSNETRRPQPPAVPERKSRRTVFIFLAIAVLLAAGAAYRFWPTPATAPGLVEVPPLVGKSLDVARRALQDLHLAVGAISQEPSSNVAQNTVLDEFPKAGKKVDPGTAIDLVVSVLADKPTPPTVRVPNLVGLSLNQARNQLQAIGLVLGNSTQQPKAGVSPGTVLGQNPNPGSQVQKNSSVDLTVSKEEVAQILAMSVSPYAKPRSISAGQRSVVGVVVKRPDGTAIPNASVSIAAGGGAFDGSGSRMVTGNTNENGFYDAYWTAPQKVAKGYVMDVTVTKGGFQDWKGQVTVDTSQPALPNFAGTWEMFENTYNGAAKEVSKQNPLRITQNGSLVQVFGRDLTITSAGTVTYQTFAAHDDKYGHEVATEDQADLADTMTLRVEGSTLIYETIFDYRRQYFGHPPGRDLRIMKYRRIGP